MRTEDKNYDHLATATQNGVHEIKVQRRARRKGAFGQESWIQERREVVAEARNRVGPERRQR